MLLEKLIGRRVRVSSRSVSINGEITRHVDGTVGAVDGHLIHLTNVNVELLGGGESSGNDIIINCASTNFISAELIR